MEPSNNKAAIYFAITSSMIGIIVGLYNLSLIKKQHKIADYNLNLINDKTKNNS